MTRIFIDTNIFIDIIAKREGFMDAAKVFSFAPKTGFSLHASVLTMANIAYVLRKVIGIDRLYIELEKFSNLVSVEPMTKEDYHTAISLKSKDFEDTLQYQCALSSKCDIIVTRNKKDFPIEKIKVLTPTEFLLSYNS